MLGRDGNISVVRVGLLVALAGILLVVAAGIAFFFDQASRRSPLDIEVYPGAVEAGISDETAISRNVFYRIPEATAEEVSEHYNRLLAEFEPEEPIACVRDPRTGDFPGYQPGSGTLPYRFICMFDRSGFRATQFTRVLIQPGVEETNGQTVVVYEQFWQS